VAHASGVCLSGSPKGCRMNPGSSPRGRTKFRGTVKAHPELTFDQDHSVGAGHRHSTRRRTRKATQSPNRLH
jgi:hypothetical protein